MSPQAALHELRNVLVRERTAIRTMDSATVNDCAEQKSMLFGMVAIAVRKGELPQSELQSLIAELRQNGVLLAFARDCVRDVLGIGNPKRAQATRAVRLSVSG